MVAYQPRLLNSDNDLNSRNHTIVDVFNKQRTVDITFLAEKEVIFSYICLICIFVKSKVKQNNLSKSFPVATENFENVVHCLTFTGI
jgi:hypothetical protein